MGAAALIGRCASLALVLLASSPAAGQATEQALGQATRPDARFCPNRPDLGSGACTTEPGRVLVELSVLDAERDEEGDATLIGDVLVRTGLDDRTELQLGWTPLALFRGPGERVTGVGDVRVGVRRNLVDPTGEGFAVAVEPFVTLPVGRRPIGRDGASYGVALPVGVPLSGKWALGFTGELRSEKDADGDGRHAALLGIVGLGYAVSDRVGVVGEVSVERDAPATALLAAGSVAWRPRDLLQLDLLVAAGLNRDSPDVRVALGGAILF